jgi:hypothetical protein
MSDLSQRGVTLRILSMGDLDAGTPTRKLMLTMLGAVATFERELMLERQREGPGTCHTPISRGLPAARSESGILP